jgi:hypothetical protein
MIPRRPLSPLALFASACTIRPLGPASPSDFVAQDPQYPDVHAVELPSQSDALHGWHLPPIDTWAAYAKYTLLTALPDRPRSAALPDVGVLDEVDRAWTAGRTVGAAGLPLDTLWIVDMRGAVSVTFGLAISYAASGQAVSLVPTFNNWPAPNELVPAEETLAAMVAGWPRQPEYGSAGSVPVFLLDSWRLAYRFDDPGDETYDNRYVLSSSDLPGVELLRARGIRNVVYVVEDRGRTSVEEDDLHDTFLQWEAAGLQIAMVDLESLANATALAHWDALLATNALVVTPHKTILDDPAFFARAHGGFGGGHAAAWPGWVAAGGGRGARGFGGGHPGFGGGRGGGRGGGGG